MVKHHAQRWEGADQKDAPPPSCGTEQQELHPCPAPFPCMQLYIHLANVIVNKEGAGVGCFRLPAPRGALSGPKDCLGRGSHVPCMHEPKGQCNERYE